MLKLRDLHTLWRHFQPAHTGQGPVPCTCKQCSSIHRHAVIWTNLTQKRGNRISLAAICTDLQKLGKCAALDHKNDCLMVLSLWEHGGWGLCVWCGAVANRLLAWLCLFYVLGNWWRRSYSDRLFMVGNFTWLFVWYLIMCCCFIILWLLYSKNLKVI